MGNEQTEEENKEDYVTFQVIQETLNIKDRIIFRKYLQEIFNDLSNRSASKNIKFMSRTTFYDYIKLPIFISEKLYSSFSNKNKEGLIIDDIGLYLSSYPSLLAKDTISFALSSYFTISSSLPTIFTPCTSLPIFLGSLSIIQIGSNCAEYLSSV